jgi:predicted ATPase/signal transduction histidine kinase
VVIAAIRASDGLAVVLKRVRDDQPDLRGVADLHHEHHVLRRVQGEGVVRELGLEEVEGRPTLILEDAGPDTLKSWLQGRRLSPPRFLATARQIARALQTVHRQRLLHRDVNPSNIVVDATGSRFTLVDFGLATPWSATGADPLSSEIGGTLQYMAPEQTGRMDRGVDYRTDLYSLGATFYEMLTGGPPFDSLDPIELVHCHLAKPPVHPSEIVSGIPPILGDIVLRLLAKAPDERYQSAAAVVRDLTTALESLGPDGHITPFEIGRHDTPVDLRFPAGLVGRAREGRLLTAALERASGGSVELVLISGPPGVGKSALADVLVGPASLHKAFYVRSKADLLESSAPFSTLVHAFRALVRELLKLPEESIASWRRLLRRRIGRGGGLLVDAVPELDRLLGPQTRVRTLGPMERQARVRLVFQAFIQTFARQEHPLVLFLDDLQWTDADSLEMLRLLMTDAETRNLVVVGTYRSEEEEVGKSVLDLRDAVVELGVERTDIALEPLDREAVAAFCQATLRCSAKDAAPLAEVLLAKTGGNPLFLRHLIVRLVDAGLFARDADTGAWIWELDAVRAQEVTDNVASLMVDAVAALPEEARAVLELLACVGKEVDLRLAAAVLDRPVDAVYEALEPAIARGMLIPIGEAELAPVRSLTAGLLAGTQLRYRFAHDRIQDVCYGLSEPPVRMAHHLRIGRAMARQQHAGESVRPFEIADHLSRAAPLVTDPAERVELAQALVDTARLAMHRSAFERASELLRIARTLLPSDPWQTHRRLTFDTSLLLAESSLLTGAHDRADEVLDSLLGRAESRVDIAVVHDLRVIQQTVRGDYDQAIEWGRRGLLHFSVAVPRAEIRERWGELMDTAQASLGDRDPEELLTARETDSEAELAVMRLLSDLATPAYFSNPMLSSWILTAMAARSFRYGNSVYSPMPFVCYGMVLAVQTQDFARGDAFGRVGVELARRVGVPAALGKALHVYCTHLRHWSHALVGSPDLFEEGHRAAYEGGDLVYASHARAARVFTLFALGHPLPDVQREARSALAFVRRVRYLHMEHALEACLHAATLLASPGSPDARHFDEESWREYARSSPLALCAHDILKLMVAVIRGDTPEALQRAALARERISFAAGQFMTADHCTYEALALLRSAAGALESERSAVFARVAVNVRKLTAWAESCPANFAHKLLLVRAELERARGQAVRAMALFEQAITLARHSGFAIDEALALELAGRCHLEQGLPMSASAFVQKAAAAWSRWGADAKVEALRAEHADLLRQDRRAAGSRVGGASSGVTLLQSPESSTLSASAERLDLLSVLKAARAVSSEVVTERFVRTMMKVTLEAAGAERGWFFLEDEDEGPIALAWGNTSDSVTEALDRVPLARCPEVPRAIVDYVRRTERALVLPDASAAGLFVTDADVRRLGVRSVLCAPVHRHGRLVGVLYLDNNLTGDAFSDERASVLELLSSQISISFENATLFGRLSEEVAERRAAQQELIALNRELEERVAERTRELARSNADLESFAYVASHDLQEPLRMVASFTELLERRYGDKLDESGVRYIRFASDGARRMSELIRGLLDYSRITTRGRPLEPVDLNAVCREVLSNLAVALADSGGSVDLGPLPTVPADRIQLAQLFQNLIGNALKFCGDSAPDVHIRAEEGPDCWIVEVADNGIGVEERYRERIFEVFRRLHGRERYPGSGIGLSIAKRIVERHGGRIWVESGGPGLGCSFRFTIPVGPTAKPDEAAQPTVSRRST